MIKLFNSKARVAVIVTAMLAAGLPVGASAAGLDDASLLMEKANLLMSRAQGTQAQASAIAARDSQALSSTECNGMKTAAQDAAVQYVTRGQVISPSSVIQNSTCFLDVMGIKVPVSLTGIGFLDSAISSIGSKLMSSACAQGMNYLNDLKSSAVNQLKTGVSGALNIGQLNVGGVNVGGIVNNATSSTANSLITNTTNAASANAQSGLFSAAQSSNLFSTQTSGSSTGF